MLTSGEALFRKSAAKCDAIFAEAVGDAKTNAELSSISSQRIALCARKNGMFQNLMEIIPFSVGGIGLEPRTFFKMTTRCVAAAITAHWCENLNAIHVLVA